jgi:hypothetical protein
LDTVAAMQLIAHRHGRELYDIVWLLNSTGILDRADVSLCAFDLWDIGHSTILFKLEMSPPRNNSPAGCCASGTQTTTLALSVEMAQTDP